MVWETLGAINEEGEEVLREMFRFAARRLGHEFSSYCGRAWARVSCCLQRSVSQAILNRIDGHKIQRDPDDLAEFFPRQAPEIPPFPEPELHPASRRDSPVPVS